MEGSKEEFVYTLSHLRYEEWIKCSTGWMHQLTNGIMVARLQGLGLFDSELYHINGNDLHKSYGEDFMSGTHISTKAYLTIIGFYEFFRTWDQMLDSHHDLKEITNRVKKLLNRLRVPLAKMEASSRYKNIDYCVPMFGCENGQICWKINDSETIFYRSLSDEVLNCLKEIRVHRIESNFNKLNESS